MVISSFERLLIVHCLVQYSTAYKIAPHSGLRVVERHSRFDLEYGVLGTGLSALDSVRVLGVRQGVRHSRTRIDGTRTVSRVRNTKP